MWWSWRASDIHWWSSHRERCGGNCGSPHLEQKQGEKLWSSTVDLSSRSWHNGYLAGYFKPSRNLLLSNQQIKPVSSTLNQIDPLIGILRKEWGDPVQPWMSGSLRVLPQGYKRPTELGSNSYKSEERNLSPGAQDSSAITGSIGCSDFEFFELCTAMLIKHKLS